MSTIGVDVGTSRVKAVRFDPDWQARDSEEEDTTVHREVGGVREQDLAQVLSAVRRVVAAVASRSPDPVDLLAVTAQGDGCWLVDRESEPLGRALLWNDNRAAGVVDRWHRDGTLDTAFTTSGCYGAPGVAHAQLHWLRQHEPARLERAGRLLSCGSWVFSRLTGREVLEASDAANPFCSARTGEYAPDLLGLFDIAGLAHLLPDVVSGPDRVGALTSQAADEVGLPAGTPVAIAPYDVPATALGTGTVATGRAFAVLGTTLCTGVVTEDPMLHRPPNGLTLPGGAPGRWLVAYATMAGTEVLDWAVRMLGLRDVAALLALAEQATRPDVPLVLPYLSPAGERSPFLDSTVRGSVHGLDVMHGREDLARGVLDGLTLVVLDCLRAAGSPTELSLSGGGAQSELWSQSICDAVGLPVTCPDTSEIGARGAVLAGATDLGMFPDVEAATAAAVGAGRVLEPRAEETERLRAGHARLLQVREATASGHALQTLDE